MLIPQKCLLNSSAISAVVFMTKFPTIGLVDEGELGLVF